MALLLQERGYSDVFALQGGWQAWLDLGYPTEPVGPVEARRDAPSVVA